MTIQHKDITNINLHETKGVSTAVTGTFLKASAGVGVWGYQEYAMSVDMATIDAVDSWYIVAPFNATIVKAYSAIDSAIATADTLLTLSIGGVNVTNGVITIAFTGSAAGDVDSCTPTALNVLTAGQVLKITSDGGTTTTCRAHVVVILQRTV